MNRDIPPLLPQLETDLLEEIFAIVASSPVPSIDWKDRGTAPVGYCEGVALAFSTVVRKYLLDYDSAQEQAKANTWNQDKDVLAYYAPQFNDLKMWNHRDGLETLRHLWVLLYGLGMRESSGNHCEGRDMSADNVTSDTAEAGLFQTSWNCHVAHEQMDVLFYEYQQHGAIEQGFMDIFHEGVECDDDDWANYGGGDGAKYQSMAKLLPAFACEFTAVGLRNARQHWGPINSYEVELRPEVDAMLSEVQALFMARDPKDLM